MSPACKSLFHISWQAGWRTFCRCAGLNFLAICNVFRQEFALFGGRIPRDPAYLRILNWLS